MCSIVRLLDKNRSPVGGYYYVCQDGQILSTSGNFDKLLRRVFDYLSANSLPIPIDLAGAIEDQICSRQPKGRCSGEPDGQQPTVIKHNDVAKCINRGDQTREKQCSSCSGRIMAKIFACSVHGECTLFRKSQLGVKCCYGCRDFSPPSS